MVLFARVLHCAVAMRHSWQQWAGNYCFRTPPPPNEPNLVWPLSIQVSTANTQIYALDCFQFFLSKSCKKKSPQRPFLWVGHCMPSSAQLDQVDSHAPDQPLKLASHSIVMSSQTIIQLASKGLHSLSQIGSRFNHRILPGCFTFTSFRNSAHVSIITMRNSLILLPDRGQISVCAHHTAWDEICTFHLIHVPPVIGLQCPEWRVPANLHQTIMDLLTCNLHRTPSPTLLEARCVPLEGDAGYHWGLQLVLEGR